MPARQPTDFAIEVVDIEALTPDPENARTHGDRNLDAIKSSLQQFGQRRPLVVARGNGGESIVIAGNGTLEAAKALGWSRIAISRVPRGWSPDKARAYALADNRTAELADWDADVLAMQLVDLDALGWDLSDLGFDPLEPPTDPGEVVPVSDERTPNLADRFGVPPMSILDQRAGYWQDRKRRWTQLGIDSEQGRQESLLMSSMAMRVPDYYEQKARAEAQLGRALSHAEFEADHMVLPDTVNSITQGTSIFDPVLAELAYRWFSPPGGQVFDPFAGGSVRGIVAGTLGRNYTGIELRAEQVEANRQQWAQRTGREVEPAADTLADVADPAALTPVQKVGKVWVKRDDAFNVGGSRGGKVRACQTIIETALAEGSVAGLVTAGSRQSPQVNIVATLAARYGLPCRVHVPSGDLTPELEAAQAAGAELVQHSPGYNNVIIARAREDAEARGWLEVPFGMEHPAIIAATAAQVADLPRGIKRIVVPVGSGMALSGILHGLAATGRNISVLGVQVGADPLKRIDKYAPPGWRDRCTIVQSTYDYHDGAEETALEGIQLDPIYEAKCLEHLQPGDLLWVVGRRATAAGHSGIGTAHWLVGDSLHMDALLPADYSADMILSCPPYHDLEKYSDDPADISNMPYEQFMEVYRTIIGHAVARLRDDRFIVWVVGEIRDPKGRYRGFVPDTIDAFVDAGAAFYNEGILVAPIGTLRLRMGRIFTAGRKWGKTHQNVLVFVKGDAKRATEACGPVIIPAELLADDEGEADDLLELPA